MDRKRIIYLYLRDRAQLCSPEEKEELKRLFLDRNAEEILTAYWNNEWDQLDDKTEVMNAEKILTEILLTRQKIKPDKKWWQISVAAMFLLIGIAVFMVMNRNKQTDHLNAAEHILPGKNSAILTLANGKKLVLSTLKNGEIVREAGLKLIKTAEGQLQYSETSGAVQENTGWNTLATTNGEQYQVQLPDGTRVWLNAAAELKFPSSFLHADTRIVELTGEAYFEVAKDATHPFIVRTGEQELKVLGTHFNINGYKDDGYILTTLLEGAVEIKSADDTKVFLKPGQQAQVQQKALKIVAANPAVDIAWKNGDFTFNTNIKNVMRQVARWYNIEVNYQGTISDEKFYGTVSRLKNLSEILRLLELTERVHFKIEGRRITVME